MTPAFFDEYATFTDGSPDTPAPSSKPAPTEFSVPMRALKRSLTRALASVPRRLRKYRTYADGCTRMHPAARALAAQRKASARQSAEARRG